ncbi:hypothetical protein FZEAL_8386 [Fusarium zealandicum]|uniref:Uncharacterized protein n=1 Tax=Fusarium zealandicum TaxID=1053134 RepID=A0A8H4UE06_9HYPO|nr:hypothetical protein FZEAL_8386 [Fusarium zealandicum]
MTSINSFLKELAFPLLSVFRLTLLGTWQLRSPTALSQATPRTLPGKEKALRLASVQLRYRLPLTAYRQPPSSSLQLHSWPVDSVSLRIPHSYMQRRWRLLHDSGCLISQATPHPARDLKFTPQTPTNDENMASFARSIKSPYLSPRLRPSMPGRTMSTNSDLNIATSAPNSPRSDDIGDLVLSGRNTPTFPPSRSGYARDGYFLGEDMGSRNVRNLDDNPRSAPGTPSAPSTPRSCSRARPIAIELPQLKRFSTAPARTPPEPLSGRGDLPGGYFPHHEDPNSRVHRPHPFQHQADARMSRLISESGPVYADRPTSHPAQSASMTQSNTPVASYLAPGFHDSPLPMGKYYPSNYENRNGSQTTLRPALNGTFSSNIGPDSQAIPRTAPANLANPEMEIRRKLQQYQRDMIAQASMAANELLGSSAKSGSSLSAGLSLDSLPHRDSRFAAPTPHKPLSPRLLPLGSPGPVTPMDLESFGRGDYLGR